MSRQGGHYILGGIIAGTPGAIIGGMHNMGKEEPHKIPEIRSNYMTDYLIEYVAKNGHNWYFTIFRGDLGRYERMFPDKNHYEVNRSV